MILSMLHFCFQRTSCFLQGMLACGTNQLLSSLFEIKNLTSEGYGIEQKVPCPLINISLSVLQSSFLFARASAS